MLKTSLIVLAIAFIAGSASASLLIYEPFNYNTGSLIIPGSTTPTGNGLSDPNGPNAPTTWLEGGAFTTGTTPHQITANGLTGPTGFPASVGKAAALEGGGSARSDFKELARMNLPGQPYGANSVLYYSLLINVADITGLTTANTNANANNDLIVGFNNATGATGTEPNTWGDELTIRLGATAGTYDLGIRASTTVAATTYWSQDLSPGATHLVVTRFTESATPGSGGLSELWIDPNSSTFGGTAPTADGSTIGTYSATAANDHTNSLLIGAGVAANSNPNETDIDELRVGTTWADVTSLPEPASVGLVAVGLMLIAARGRKRIA